MWINRKSILVFGGIVCAGLLFYLGYKASQLPVKETLFVVPKENTLQGLDVKALEKINEEKLMLTYETNDIVSIKVLDKNFSAKAVGTNYTYPYVYKLPLLSGGFFTKDMQESERRAVVLNKAAAFYFFGGTDIMDEEIKMNNESCTVVGVINDYDKDSNNVYYPITLAEKQPSALLVSLEGTSSENAATVLNGIHISSRDYYFTNLKYVQDVIQGKFWLSLDLSLFLLLIFLVYKVFILLKNQVTQIKMSLDQEIYMQELLWRKPIYLLKVILYIVFSAGFLWGIFLLFSKYVVKFLQWDIDWEGIRLAGSFHIMTENLLKYHQYTRIMWVVFCFILLYAVVMGIAERIMYDKK